MKKKLCLTLMLITALTAACGDNADSSVSQTIKNTATETVTATKETANTAVKKATESVQVAGENASRAVKDTIESTTDKAMAAVEKVEEKVETTNTAQVKKDPYLATTPAPVSTSSNFVAGEHYDVLPVPVPTGTDKVQVAELFWYGCGHCFNLEPHMKKYRSNLPKGTEFVEVPAVFGNQWKFHAQAFYTAQALGIQEETHQEIFDMLHIKKKRVGTLKQLQGIFAKHGKDAEEVESAFNSFSVDGNLRAAGAFARNVGVNSVPTLVVNGKYRTTVGKAGGPDQLLKLLDHLVEKSKKERS